jgi:hypothetical protein
MNSSLSEDYWQWMLERLAQDTSGSDWDERWSQFTAQPGVTEYVEDPGVLALKEYLDQRSESDRDALLDSTDAVSLLSQLTAEGIVEPAAAETDATSVAPSEEGYDEGAWQTFAQSYLAQWDGSDETWDQFREWFLYYAAEQSLGLPAQQLLDSASQQTVPERIATFAQYGAHIQPAAVPEGAEQQDADDMDSLLAEILAEHPEFEEIPPERRSEIVAEVTQVVASEY